MSDVIFVRRRRHVHGLYIRRRRCWRHRSQVKVVIRVFLLPLINLYNTGGHLWVHGQKSTRKLTVKKDSTVSQGVGEVLLFTISVMSSFSSLERRNFILSLVMQMPIVSLLGKVGVLRGYFPTKSGNSLIQKGLSCLSKSVILVKPSDNSSAIFSSTFLSMRQDSEVTCKINSRILIHDNFHFDEKFNWIT